MTLSGSTPTVINTTLTGLTETVIEGEVLHNTATLTLTLEFGTQTETCRKIVQDISLFFEECSSFCLSNDCPASLPYFKHPVSDICVSDCPFGYTESGDLCAATQFCHSTCGACTVKNDPTKCTSCSSSLTSLTYNAFVTGQTEGSCLLPTANNAQFLLTVDKNTVLVTSLLKSVTSNSVAEATSGSSLSSFLYTQNVIEVSSLSSSTITFDFDTLPIHQKLLVRVRALTECTTQNTTIQMTLSGDTSVTVNSVLTTNTESILEGQVVHNDAAFTLTIDFGTQGETCRKSIQDISVFFEKCQTYCGSNDCPDVEPYYKHPVDSKCVSICPDGFL